MGWAYAFPNPCELESYASYTLLVFLQVKIQRYNFFEYGKWMESCALEKWESTLNLCVHAHGPDVELILEASFKIFNHLNDPSGNIKFDPV